MLSFLFKLILVLASNGLSFPKSSDCTIDYSIALYSLLDNPICATCLKKSLGKSLKITNSKYTILSSNLIRSLCSICIILMSTYCLTKILNWKNNQPLENTTGQSNKLSSSLIQFSKHSPQRFLLKWIKNASGVWFWSKIKKLATSNLTN